MRRQAGLGVACVEIEFRTPHAIDATLYGKGVYFARDASYSTFPLYCAPDAQGVQTIFLVRAVVGQWSKGVKDQLTPDVRDPARNILYDCTVDNVRDPSIFVTYHDAQAYPEYMIKFSQTTQHTGDPPVSKSTSELGYGSMAWGVRNLISTQVTPRPACRRTASTGPTWSRASSRLAPFLRTNSPPPPPPQAFTPRRSPGHE